MKKRKDILLYVLKVVLSALLLFYIFRYKVDYQLVYDKFLTASLPLLALAFSLHLLGFYISAVRWKVLLKAQDIQAKTLVLMEYYIVSSFFNLLIPGRYGGDLSRIYDTSRASRQPEKSIAVILFERGSGLFVLVFFGLVAAWYKYLSTDVTDLRRTFLVYSGMFALLLVGFLVGFLFFHPRTRRYMAVLLKLPVLSKFKQRLGLLSRAFSIYWYARRSRNLCLLLSFLLQLNVILHYYLISLAFHIQGITLVDHFVFIPILLLVLILPLSFGGLGVRDITVIESFRKLGANVQAGGAFAITDFIMQVLQGAIGGILYMLRKERPV